MYCPRHPKIETNLRCGKCDEVICPKCTVQTPVGARCPDCAKLTRLPTFQVSAIDYLKAVGIGMGLAIILGLGWGMAVPIIHGYSYLLALLAGYIIGGAAAGSLVFSGLGRGVMEKEEREETVFSVTDMFNPLSAA